MRIGSGRYYLVLAVIGAWAQVWAVFVIGFAAFLASAWLDSGAARKNRAWGERLKRYWGDRQVRIVPDLSRPLAARCPLLLPRVCLDRLSDAEVDALLARQAGKPIRWPLLLPIAILAGLCAVPRSLVPFASIASMLCIWALMVCVYRRLDAQADAKAIQTTGDPATYIQALVKADRLMQEIPRRQRMSTWWLFPASLESRIAAITVAIPPARDSG
jgi:TRAP-type C4-dicarboxylate transport system permease large subunit